MDTVTTHIRKRLLERVGVPLDEIPKGGSIEEILDLQINWDYFAKVASRMVVGFFRYKPRPDQEVTFNYRDKIRDKLKLYEETRNKEYLVDAGNYLMMEYDRPTLDGTFFKSTDDQDHAEVTGHRSAQTRG